ncbi:hypothetical protein [Acidithiobacillus sp.]|uniref:hypothetical protein n=1 Tax=Acidithiobacillus sp. TaxID=1872118 RepID=UPI0025C1973D|nr:hypothetical protein [Acidithiobacillus sp.]
MSDHEKMLLDNADMTEEEGQQVAEAFRRAYAQGLVSEKDHARGMVQGAMARWQMQIYEAAGKPHPVPDNIYEGQPDIERVGIPAIDDALPFLKPNGEHPRLIFLNALSYLMRESDDALEIAGARAKDCDKAAALLREAAALMKGRDNEPLGHLIESIAPWAEQGKYGRVFPEALQGYRLAATQHHDSLSASLKGKGGPAARGGAIVRALVPFFPNERGFFAKGGNTLISRLAVLCGASKATPAYVLSTLKQARRTAPQPTAPAKAASPDESLLRLLRKP